ncbi:tetratricopeptide repeat protein [Nannocystis pusilla]|uniref:tetratricopeptide repeat protein n=1 Tax=Nannocystis pusilla TaxID=889268 RepID=UPI003B8078B3
MLQPEVLAELEALYDRGLYVSTLRAAEAMDGGPLAWRDAAACAFASRLLRQVGAPRASSLVAIRAHRAAPLDPRAGVVWAHYLAGERGPYAALEYLRTFPVDAAEGEEQADLRLSRAGMLVELRDFEAAEYEICRAEALCPGYGWAAVVRAGLLTAQDRLDDALAVAQQVLRDRPWQRSAIQAAAHALLELGRVDEAAALLTEAVARLESGALALQLGHLEMTRRRPREAWSWFVRAGQLFVFIEPEALAGLVGACCEAACEAGDDAAAIALARACGDPGLARLAERLERGQNRRVVSLAVPYVRQAHKTCAPATLSALCQFFGWPAEHLAIAEEICFDGTPWASERRWAEQQGLVAREFTVTWDSATGLLDRGVPLR